MKTKHTAGPWEYRNATNADNTGGFDCAIMDAKGRIIAEVFEHVGYSAETGQAIQNKKSDTSYDKRPAEANALLIAAAPEMFKVVDKLSKFSPNTISETTVKEVLLLVKEAREVIAKATGELCLS